MIKLLHIDTSGALASIAFSQNDQCLLEKTNDRLQDHATWIHSAIQEGSTACGISLNELDGVSVTIGPGSYTGLRVGLSTAKGFCYALQKPLLTIPTLELMASVIPSTADQLICPMIDARRMEVYTALYDAARNEIQPAHALILEPNCFDAVLQKQTVLYCGNGAVKFKSLCTHPNAHFVDSTATAKNQIRLALQKLRNNDFADLAYQDPLYVKEFYTPVSPSY